MFEGEKTYVFWVGLIILALASVGLFGILWLNLVAFPYQVPVKYQVPFIVGTAVFIIIGLHMMMSGVKKEKE